MKPRPQEVEERERIVLELAGLPGGKLRAASPEAKLGAMEEEEMAAVFNRVCGKAKDREPSYLKAYHALPELLRSPAFDRGRILRLRAVARRREYLEVLQMFLELPPRLLLLADPDAPQDSIWEDLSLGHRRSLGKSSRMNLLRRLLHDREPAVIRDLLLTPRLTETEILKIASRKPNSPEALKEIFRCPKWTARYRVKKALACNPSCPPAVALHLLKSLLASDLLEVSRMSRPHATVQGAAHPLLAERREKTG